MWLCLKGAAYVIRRAAATAGLISSSLSRVLKTSHQQPFYYVRWANVRAVGPALKQPVILFCCCCSCLNVVLSGSKPLKPSSGWVSN